MSQIITGDEENSDPRKPEGALAEFYRAFNSRDLALMEQNWAGDEAVLYHELGGVRHGWTEIKELYEQTLLASPAGVLMTFHDYRIERFSDTFFAVGLERGLLRTPKDVLEFRIRATRIFGWRNGRWRQLHHHGSIEEPELLANYLTLFLTGHTAGEMA
jgi:ketosteroid isomerase-like protein